MRADPDKRLKTEAALLSLALAVTLVLLGVAVRDLLGGYRDAARPTDRSDWFGPDDYPIAAIRANLEGTTTIRMTFDAGGGIRGCAITRSSGHPVLDRAACDVVLRRARIAPHADGGTVVRTRRVVWRLPRAPRL